MIFNTNTPYTSSFGTAPLTLNSGNVYIKASNALNDGTANYDMPIFMESSNATPIGFGLQMNNATSATSTNSAYFGTTTGNDLVMMTANTRRLTITSTGRVGIGTGSPQRFCTYQDQIHTQLVSVEHQIVISTTCKEIFGAILV